MLYLSESHQYTVYGFFARALYSKQILFTQKVLVLEEYSVAQYLASNSLETWASSLNPTLPLYVIVKIDCARVSFIQREIKRAK